jgi:hypothetical protein
MARIEPDQLQDPEPIFLASSLRTARKVEALLDSRGVDYVVQVEELGRTTLFGTMRHAAGFYVTEGQASHCRALLADAGLSHGIVEED